MFVSSAWLESMPLPQDITLTKLRILYRREEEKLKRMQEETLTQRRKAEQQWMAFVKRCDELGYCAFCEKQKDHCRCVFLASNTTADLSRA